MNRLTEILKLLNWQGGTIHQANVECQARLGLDQSFDILSISDFEFELLKARLKTLD